jgi:hypothetical protein
MALSPQDVADAMTAGGIEDAQELADLIAFARLIRARQQLVYQRARADAGQRASAQQAEAAKQALDAQTAAVDAHLTTLLAGS